MPNVGCGRMSHQIFFAVVDAVQVDEQVDVVLVLAPRAEVIGHAGARKAPEDRRAVRLQAGVAAQPEGRAGRERQQVRQEVARRVHDVDRGRAVRHRDVHVHAEDEQRSRQLLQLLDDVLVALAWRDDLIDPARERVRARRRHRQAGAIGGRAQLGADLQHLVLRAGSTSSQMFVPELHDRLVHLALHLIAQRRRSGREQLRDVRAQLPGRRVDDLELLLDADREPVRHGVHRSTGQAMILWRLSCMYDQGAGAELTGNVVGNIRRLEGVESPQLGNLRDVLVYLPPSYAAERRGTTRCSTCTTARICSTTPSRSPASGTWTRRWSGSPRRASRRSSWRVPEHGDRTGRASTGRSATPAWAAAAATRTWRSSSTRCKPMVNTHFRTRREAEHTGHHRAPRWAGLISLYAFLRRPDIFGFCRRDEPVALVRRAAPSSASRPTSDAGRGGCTWTPAPAKAETRCVRRARWRGSSVGRRRVPGCSSGMSEARGAGHNEVAWSARFERAVGGCCRSGERI